MPATGDDLTFSRGSETGDPDERPVHQVFLRPVRMDVREATNADFSLFLNDRGNDCDGNPCLNSNGEGVRLHQEAEIWKAEPGYEDHPVVHVTWYGAHTYCMWRGMELPTEAQWEMAASGSGELSYPWGEQPPTCEMVTFDSCGATAPKPVCSCPHGGSQEGVCDLSGNMAEWVSDWYKEDFYSTCTADCREPMGPTQETGGKSSARRKLRGSGLEPACRRQKLRRFCVFIQPCGPALCEADPPQQPVR